MSRGLQKKNRKLKTKTKTTKKIEKQNHKKKKLFFLENKKKKVGKLQLQQTTFYDSRFKVKKENKKNFE